MNIFIPIVGQFTNVGDTLHRRILLSWLKAVGTLHIYIGNAPASFISGLQLPSNVILYRSIYDWLWSLSRSAYRKTSFVFNPGEMTFRKKRLFYELALVPLLILIKLKKGKIVRVGVAAKSNSPITYKSLWKFLLSLSTNIYWRTADSNERFGLGEVIPDLGFAESKYTNKDDLMEEQKKILIVSMRFDRKEPSKAWISAIKSIAERASLTIKVLSQVKMDNNRTIALAEELSCEAIVWTDDFNHLEQESRVRDIYAKTKIVISDRLHVLIAAATEGGIPSCILTEPSDKVKDHFDVIGFRNESLFSEDFNEITRFLERQLVREKEIRACVSKAQSILSRVRQQLIADLTLL